ncbi:MAG: hypothetical protein WA398_08665 [Nitrososphaeraceae archaeon]
MNPKLVFVAIAIVAAFGIAAVVGLATVTPVLAQDNMTMEAETAVENMTGGNMTGGNMTAP